VLYILIMDHKDVDEIWVFLNKHGIVKVGELKVHDSGFFTIKQGRDDINHNFYGRYEDFNLNLARVMLLFEELIKVPLKDEENLNIKFQLFCEIVIVLLMGALEAFLRDTFVAIISNVKKYKIKIKENTDLRNIFKDIKNNIPIFQKKTSLKKAYSCIDINLVELIENEIWKRIFSINELDSNNKFTGYMKMRHNFLHGGFSKTLYNQIILNEYFIRTAIRDVVTVVYTVQINIPDYTLSFEIDPWNYSNNSI